MPGDINSSIGYLDVQFGAMDIMLDGNTFDSVSDNKFGTTNASNLETSTAPSSNIDLNSSTQNTSMDAYSSAKPNTQSSISSAISQGVSNIFFPITTLSREKNVCITGLPRAWKPGKSQGMSGNFV